MRLQALRRAGRRSTGSAPSLQTSSTAARNVRPDWASYSGGAKDFELRPIGAGDLVGPDGQSAAGGEARGFADDASQPSGGGVSLQMTECEVVRRVGPVDKVDFGVNDRGERAVGADLSQGYLAGDL